MFFPVYAYGSVLSRLVELFVIILKIIPKSYKAPDIWFFRPEPDLPGPF